MAHAALLAAACTLHQHMHAVTAGCTLHVSNHLWPQLTLRVVPAGVLCCQIQMVRALA
jgi:hypothetical protein